MENLLDQQTRPPVNLKFLEGKLKVDLAMQIIALAGTLISMALQEFATAFCFFYLGIGMYQLISSLVHLAAEKNNPLYKAYYIQLIIHGIFFLGMFTSIGIFTAYLLLFLSPVSGIYYFVITILNYNHVHHQQ